MEQLTLIHRHDDGTEVELSFFRGRVCENVRLPDQTRRTEIAGRPMNADEENLREAVLRVMGGVSLSGCQPVEGGMMEFKVMAVRRGEGPQAGIFDVMVTRKSGGPQQGVTSSIYQAESVKQAGEAIAAGITQMLSLGFDADAQPDPLRGSMRAMFAAGQAAEIRFPPKP